jgi:hypothetical protein
MTQEKPAHIEPSKHSTDEVDVFLDMVQGNVDATPGAGSPVIMPDTAPRDDGKPVTGKPVTDKPT